MDAFLTLILAPIVLVIVFLIVWVLLEQLGFKRVTKFFESLLGALVHIP